MEEKTIKEIRKLKTQIVEKDKYIRHLEAQNKKLLQQQKEAKDTIDTIIQNLNENEYFNDENNMSSLENISFEPDLSTSINNLFDYMTKEKEIIISRLCSQLKGHVDFLTRLASSPTLQSMFLISNKSGEVFLQETSRRLLLEQALRTSQFIKEISNKQLKKININNSISINDILDLKKDINNRNQKISDLLNNDHLNYDELKTMVLQEITISSILRRFATSNFKECKHTSKNTTETTVKHSAQTEKWQKWCKNLYVGITMQFNPNVNYEEMRTLIEEAALTSVGAIPLQRK